MKEQRKTLIILMNDAPLSDSERQEMNHLVGFLDHFIFEIYGVVAEYPTANRNIY